LGRKIGVPRLTRLRSLTGGGQFQALMKKKVVRGDLPTLFKQANEGGIGKVEALGFRLLGAPIKKAGTWRPGKLRIREETKLGTKKGGGGT